MSGGTAGRASTGPRQRRFPTRPTRPFGGFVGWNGAHGWVTGHQLHQPRLQHPPRHPDRHRDAHPRWFAGRQQPTTAGVQGRLDLRRRCVPATARKRAAVADGQGGRFRRKRPDAHVAGLSRPEVRFADRQRRLAGQLCDQRTRAAVRAWPGTASSRMRRRRRSRSSQTLAATGQYAVIRARPRTRITRRCWPARAHPCRRFRRRLRDRPAPSASADDASAFVSIGRGF